MKKKLLLLLTGLITQFGFTQTATDFTSSDCAGNSHNLFTELDAGKVIVITWVMPCGSCIAGAATASAEVQNFASSHPGRVKFYLVDDYGNTSCSTLNSWASTNGITTDATFSNTGNTINMTNYGTTGMPKTVVLGGGNHTVFLNLNGTPTSTDMNTAITNALNAPLSISESQTESATFNIFPNPAKKLTTLSYSLAKASEVKIEIFNIEGKKINTVFVGNQDKGKQLINIDIDALKLSNGIYFLRLTEGDTEKQIKFSVSR